MSKKLAGKKYAGSHSTVIDAAYNVAKYAAKFDEVLKISLGIIRPCRTNRSSSVIKIKDIPAGLELIIRGNMYAQNIFLYMDDERSKQKIADEVERYFNK